MALAATLAAEGIGERIGVDAAIYHGLVVALGLLRSGLRLSDQREQCDGQSQGWKEFGDERHGMRTFLDEGPGLSKALWRSALQIRH
jgi:hypothetical protein